MAEPERRIIEAIEDSPFSPQDKFRLFLTHLGARQACSVSITSGVWREGDHPRKIDSELLMDAHDALKQVYGFYEVNPSVVKPAVLAAPSPYRKRWQETVAFLVAQNGTMLGKFKEAIRANDLERLGQLYGYPRSSIQGAMFQKVISLDRLPRATIMSDPVRFLDFPLSEQKWREELARMQQWVDLVKSHSPVIYQQLRMANYCRLTDQQVDSMFGRSNP